MAVTMKDVAKEAGVSLGTVSNYINGKETVSQKNRIQIEKSILKLGYQVNEVARYLRLDSSKTIGIIIPSFSNVFAVKTISKLERKFRKANYSTYVLSYSYSQQALNGAIRSLIGKRVDGLVIMPSRAMTRDEIETINKLIAKEIPVVVFDAYAEGLHCDHVLIDNHSAIKTAMDTLFDAGHTKIALFLGPEKIHSSKERLNAYIDAYKARNVPGNSDHIYYTDYSKTMSKEICTSLLDEEPEITAIVTAGYRITLGVLASIFGKSMRIPDHISIVGFDIQDIVDITPNKLEGTFLPHGKIALAVAEVVLARIKSNANDNPTIEEIKIEYCKGESVKKLNT